MPLDCVPGETIEVIDLVEYINENAVPGPAGPPGTGIEGAYLLDGTQPITAPFAGGTQVFKNAAQAVDQTDLPTLGQVDAKIVIGTYNRDSRNN